MGGASTQISFIPEKSEQNPNNTLEVTLYGYKYNVYTHSFQCYGRDESEKRLLASLAQVLGYVHRHGICVCALPGKHYAQTPSNVLI